MHDLGSWQDDAEAQDTIPAIGRIVEDEDGDYLLTGHLGFKMNGHV
jgi:hypothetical protein